MSRAVVPRELEVACWTQVVACVGGFELFLLTAGPLEPTMLLLPMIVGAINMVIALGLLRGRPSARILSTILASLSILSIPLGIVQGTLNLPADAIWLVIDLMTVVLIWRPRSSAYFAAVTAARRVRKLIKPPTF